MQFFLHEIVARVVAITLCVSCSRTLWNAFAERKIVFFNSDLLDWSRWVAHRDATPVQYWMQIGLQSVTLAASLVLAIFGWFPNS